MRPTAPAIGRRFRRQVSHLLWVLATVAGLAGCAGPPRIDVPAELPLQTNDQLFTIQWALQREASVARAVGRVKPSFATEATLTLALFGVDAGGRIASRDTTYIQSRFDRQPIPFALELTPTGGEARFEVRVLDYHVSGLPRG
jgi:hypothetical protein